MSLHDLEKATKPFVLAEKNGWVRYCTGELHEIKNLDDIHKLARRKNTDIAFTLPYRCIKERGFKAKGNEPILALSIEENVQVRTKEAIKALPNTPISIKSKPKPS